MNEFPPLDGNMLLSELDADELLALADHTNCRAEYFQDLATDDSLVHYLRRRAKTFEELATNEVREQAEFERSNPDEPESA